jgi:glycine reductase complex component B subunit gamma
MLTVVHVVNQFFAGIGGEDKADAPVGVVEGISGVARGLRNQFGDQARIVATVFCGDNYFQQHADEVKEAVLREVRSRKPQILLAGPAFNSGRYGIACVEICQTIAQALEIPCITAMHPENPAVANYRDYQNPKVFLLPTGETAASMTEALATMARFAVRTGDGYEKLGPAYREGYLPRGIRRLERSDRPGVERAVDMLLKKLRHEPFLTEVPMELWDRPLPARPLSTIADRRIAVITTSGVVPWGNPDRFRTYRNTFWRKYNISELKGLESGKWEAVHGGYNTAFMDRNPHYGVPLDALRTLEAEGVIGKGKLYPAYYVIPGNQGAPAVMRRVGQEIAGDLQAEGIDGVLLVAT